MTKNLCRLLALALTVVVTAVDAQVPTWMSQPPRDTPEFWYGIGEGPDPEAARRQALRAVAAKLRSNVSGKVSSTITDANGKVSSTAQVQVSEEILKTEFTRAEVEASAKSSVGTLVLLKVDMQMFVRDTKAQLDVAARAVGDAEAAVAREPLLEQFIALRRVGPDIDKAMNYSLLLVGAGAEAEGRAAYLRFSTAKRRLPDIASKLVFQLNTKPEDADIANIVAGALADQGIRTSKSRAAGANVVSVETQTRQEEIFGDKLVRLNIRFTVVDAQGRSAASREHQVSAGSRLDYRGARESALRKLTQVFAEAGPLPAMGFRD